MTDDRAGTAWERVAVALAETGTGRTGPDATGPKPAVPSGWERVAEAVGSRHAAPAGSTVAAPAVPEADGLAAGTAAPPGWSALASALDPAETAPALEGRVAAPSARTDVEDRAAEPPASAREAASTKHDDADLQDDDAATLAGDDGGAPVDPPGGGDEHVDAGGGMGELAARAGAVTRVAGRAIVDTWIGRIAAVVVVIGVAAALLVTTVLSGGGLSSKDAFAVDGQTVTVAQFNSQVQILNKLYGIQAPKQSDSASYAAFLRTTAKALAVETMLGHVAAKEGISIPQKTARDTLDQVVSTDYAGSQSSFDAALSKAGLTENEVLTQVTAQLLQDQLYTKVAGTPAVTTAEITTTYNQEKASLGTPEERTVSLIIVASTADAQSVMAQLAGGASFSSLAAKDSLDTENKSKGGAVGTATESQLAAADGQAAFAPAAFAAKLDVPFGPVAEQGGNYSEVGEVTAIKPAVVATDDKATQTAIKGYLEDKAGLAVWDAWLRQQLTAAHIRYTSTYRPSDPDAPPTESLPSVASFLASESSGSSSPSTTPNP